ncbi:MAG: hypothetical protein ACYC6L_01365 [Anaerolineae bacterium]
MVYTTAVALLKKGHPSVGPTDLKAGGEERKTFCLAVSLLVNARGIVVIQ